MRQDGDLLGRVGDRADHEILQSLDIAGVDDLGVDRTAITSPLPFIVTCTRPPPA